MCVAVLRDVGKAVGLGFSLVGIAVLSMLEVIAVYIGIGYLTRFGSPRKALGTALKVLFSGNKLKEGIFKVKRTLQHMNRLVILQTYRSNVGQRDPLDKQRTNSDSESTGKNPFPQYRIMRQICEQHVAGR